MAEVADISISGAEGPRPAGRHSYGGVVITEGGNDPQVAGLVSVAAFVPDQGESVSTLIKDPPPQHPCATDTAARG